MLFKDVVGQNEIKKQLISQVDSGRLPHAILLAGETGYGTMALALALANYVLCDNHHDGDSCDSCPECVKVNKLIHPDLHFSFPVIKKSESTNSDTFLKEWRSMLLDDKYFDYNDWLKHLKSESKQAYILQAESQSIIRKATLTSYEGGWKVIIIWLPERMFSDIPANTLLKTIEEPPKKTLFILCSEKPELLLDTIRSRTQRIDVPPINTNDLCEALTKQRGIDPAMAVNISRIAKGNYLTAIRHLCEGDDSQEQLEKFKSLMRLAYSRNLKGITAWSEQISALNRDEQRAFLAYMQNMIRENFMYNFGRPELNFMTPQELTFASKFAPFINERNIIGFAEELQRAQDDISQNVNAKNIWFNLALRTIMLIRAK